MVIHRDLTMDDIFLSSRGKIGNVAIRRIIEVDGAAIAAIFENRRVARRLSRMIC